MQTLEGLLNVAANSLQPGDLLGSGGSSGGGGGADFDGLGTGEGSLVGSGGQTEFVGDCSSPDFGTSAGRYTTPPEFSSSWFSNGTIPLW